MVDQVSSLRSEGIHVAAILSENRGVDPKFTATNEDIIQGKLSLLYSSPAAITGVERWRQMLWRSLYLNRLLQLLWMGSLCL